MILRLWSAASLVALCVVPRVAQAATITVTDGGDSGPGTLRQAIADASGGDTIEFSVATVSLSSSGLAIDRDLSFDGGAGVSITRVSGTFRILHIHSGVTFSAHHVTISNGLVSGPGAGILNQGIATLTECTVSGNTNTDVDESGSGIKNLGTMTVERSTISGNDAPGGQCGGIFDAGAGAFNLRDSTVSNNQARFAGGLCAEENIGLNVVNSTISGNNVTGEGGAIRTFTNGIIDVSHSTLVDNHAAEAGGAIEVSGTGTVRLKNSIVARNTAGLIGDDISGVVVSVGNNLIGSLVGATISGTVESNISGWNPGLGALADNGGATLTHLLASSSAAIDAGSCLDIDGNIVAQDQRGTPRPLGETCDIGAVEVSTDAQLVSMSDEPAGANCEHGGLRLDIGTDSNRNGSLETGEVESSSYVCNGADGTDGADGANGADGVDGADGVNGADGADGADGARGADGVDGQDGGCSASRGTAPPWWLAIALAVLAFRRQRLR